MRAIDADTLKEQIRKGLGVKSLENLLPAEKYIVEKIDRMPTIQPEQREDDPRADVYYLAEKIGIHQLYALVVQLRGEPEPCEDAVSRAEVLRMINCINDHHAITPYKSVGAVTEHLTRIASSLPPVTPKQQEYHEIGYRECADAVLKMWMDNVLTDGEHNRIIDKLNAKWAISEGDA